MLDELLARRIGDWVADPDSDVVYAEQVGGAWAVRMVQGVRDATTVWFVPGQRTLQVEAYVIPAPPRRAGDVYRICLMRNHGRRRVWWALDPDGSVVLRSRVGVEEADWGLPDELLGEIYEQVETTFRLLVTVGFR